MTDRPQRTGDETPTLFTLAQIQHLMRVEFSRAQRYGYPVVCLILSIDQLGLARDRFGYEAKEAILQAVIELLHERTRTSDFLGRLPDDRLMIIVPHSGLEGIEIMATRLVERAAELELQEAPGQSFTFSIGGSWLTAGETLFFDQLMRTAEECLQEAISSGGGRYIARSPMEQA
jgi:diguanylate cyclase (GGDEF)-like protein